MVYPPSMHVRNNIALSYGIAICGYPLLAYWYLFQLDMNSSNFWWSSLNTRGGFPTNLLPPLAFACCGSTFGKGLLGDYLQDLLLFLLEIPLPSEALLDYMYSVATYIQPLGEWQDGNNVMQRYYQHITFPIPKIKTDQMALTQHTQTLAWESPFLWCIIVCRRFLALMTTPDDLLQFIGGRLVLPWCW